ncbi:FAD-dependent monooxygenase [Mycobacterium sp. NPDC050441]|uniref:FAD-dependent monooxygenase n=1 Tax=Mycobacterium sp. NPDC050441 TaxID=3155403 RepID=UPI0033D6F46F
MGCAVKKRRIPRGRIDDHAFGHQQWRGTVKILCVGGGPAGLSFATLMKGRDKAHEITVLERNPAGSTYGWGITYWQPLLDKLADIDLGLADEIRDSSFRWSDTVIDLQGAQAEISGHSGLSINRRALIDIFSRRATELGINIQFERDVADPSRLPEADLIIACDGANSRLRKLHSDIFGTNVVMGRNKFVWLGTGRVFDAFNFAFAETAAGWIWFYAYGSDERTSTVIVECSPETWTGLGFDTLAEEDATALLSRIFERQLDGHPLLSAAPNRTGAVWTNFATVTNKSWHHDNIVLMGDAAHTTHYSIGSGTILALEDAIGLAEKLCRHQDLESALDSYQAERSRAIVPHQAWARNSAQWYEDLQRYIRLRPAEFSVALRARRSPMLPHVPPSIYCRLYRVTEGLYRVTQESAALQKLRERLGPKAVRPSG